MSLSPEERAKALLDRLFRLGKYHFEQVHMDPLAFIASAIREAESEAVLDAMVRLQPDKLRAEGACEALMTVLSAYDASGGEPLPREGFMRIAESSFGPTPTPKEG